MMATSLSWRADASPVYRVQIENLHVEAMLLADEAYACFAAAREAHDDPADAAIRIALACESLNTTTRLMHVIAWLLHERALIAGDPEARDGEGAERLGEPVAADEAACAHLDPETLRVVRDSERLFERVRRIDRQWRAERPVAPVQAMVSAIAARL